MKRSVLFWIIAVVVTLISLVYQRITGPTYPVSGKVVINGKTIAYKLNRSHPGETNAPVEIRTGDSTVRGIVSWKRHKTGDSWTQVPMVFSGDTLKAELPHQPVAGKLMYTVELEQGGQRVMVTGAEPIVIRFRGEVPLWVIAPHVFAMFCAFLFSARGGLEFFNKEPRFANYAYLTLGFLTVGGFVLGPLMQHYSFDVWWTGWPYGTDLTDNKTAIAFIGWVIAAIALSRAKNPKRWVLAASILTLLVYLIPHSVLGSEFDYSKADKQGNQTAPR
jgi:hypothetical protein